MLSKIRHALRTDNAFVALLFWPYFYMYFLFYLLLFCYMNREIIWFYHTFVVYLLAGCSVMFLSMAIPRRWQRIKTNEAKAKCGTLPRRNKSLYFILRGRYDNRFDNSVLFLLYVRVSSCPDIEQEDTFTLY